MYVRRARTPDILNGVARLHFRCLSYLDLRHRDVGVTMKVGIKLLSAMTDGHATTQIGLRRGAFNSAYGLDVMVV
jgi:hypothetical protein